MISRIKGYIVPGIWFFLCCMCLFPEVFFSGKVFFFADNYSLLFPGKLFISHWLKQGVFPFWNPYALSGTPFFADLGYSTMYPSTLLFMWLPVGQAGVIAILTHLWFSAMGVYWLCRQLHVSSRWGLLSGTVWLFSQPVVVVVNNLAALQSLAWIPWMAGCFYTAENNKKHAYFIPLTIAGSILGGHPQPTMVGLVISCAMYFVHSHQSFIRRLRTILLVGLFSGTLALFQLIPSLELAKSSTRITMPISESLDSSTHPLHLLDLIFPTIFSNPQQGMVWGINWNSPTKHGIFITYFGLVCFVYSVIFFRSQPKTTKTLVIISLSCLLISLGKYLPGFTWIYSHFPGASSFRNLSLILYGWSLTSSLIIGLVAENVSKIINRRYLICVWPIFICTIFIVGLFGSFQSWFPVIWRSIPQLNISLFHSIERDSIIVKNFLFFLLVSFLSFLLCVLMIKKTKSFPLIILIVLGINMLLVARTTVFLAPTTVYQPSTESPAMWLHSNTDTFLWRTISTNDYVPYTGLSVYWQNMLIRPPFGESRYTITEQETYADLRNRQDTLSPGWQMVRQIPSIDGYVTFVPQRVADYWKETHSKGSVNSIDAVPFTDARLMDQGVRYIIVDKNIFNGKIPPNLSSFPILHQTDSWAILENSNALPIIRFDTHPLGTITPLPGTINQINFQTENAMEGAVLVKVAPYPGWKCAMDGKPCVIKKDTLGMRLIGPTGKHVFHLSYTPTGWPHIAWISIFAWGIYSYLLVRNFVYGSR